MKKIEVYVNDPMQQGYYTLVEPMGQHFQSHFTPELTPKEMLELGVFGGKYLTDCQQEFPSDWFTNAKLSPEKKDISLNYFAVDASQSLQEWQRKGVFIENCSLILCSFTHLYTNLTPFYKAIRNNRIIETASNILQRINTTKRDRRYEHSTFYLSNNTGRFNNTRGSQCRTESP